MSVEDFDLEDLGFEKGSDGILKRDLTKIHHQKEATVNKPTCETRLVKVVTITKYAMPSFVLAYLLITMVLS